jgi:hypothetical protein
MMQQDLLEWTRRRPFEPFRLYVSDGTAYEIRHPELCMPTFSTVIIGLPRDPAQPIAERATMISLLHVVRVEPLAAATASA